jgi:hypothetical protein
VRYTDQLQEIFNNLHVPEATHLPLEIYLDRTIDAFHHFYITHPGFIIVFGQLQTTAPEIQKINAEFDRSIEQQVANFFCRYNPKLDAGQALLIAKIASDVIRVLQTSALFARNKTQQGQILMEAKKLLFNYLQLYLSQ